MRGERALWLPDADLGWVNPPNSDTILRHPAFTNRVRINAHGHRSRAIPLEKPAGRQRLLVLGDSFGWGFGVEQNEMFTEQIEARRPDWDLVNASVSGYGTDQELLYLRERGLQFQPDAILLVYCPNDLENNVHTEQYWHNKPRFILREGNLVLTNRPVPPLSLRQRAGKLVVGRTYFLAQLYRATRHLCRSATARGEGAVIGYDAAEARDITARLLAEMRETARQAGARFFVVGTPMDSEHAAWLRNVLDALGVPFLHLERSLFPPETYIPRDPHWNAEGHARAAEAIDRFLTEQGLFRPPPLSDDGSPSRGSTEAATQR